MPPPAAAESTVRTAGETVRAAGAVLWRAGAGGIEVAVVHRPRYDDWSLPKGKIDPGENAPRAAAREVAEETGLSCVLSRYLAEVAYSIP
ncbi:NUDIX hydrolase, partial [Klebsiella pneumoniae]|uniref:NUDIX hydrolase n=1 Tax=Klebsiella pneumoniae TaxID=573 RepID=UPI000D921AE3